MICPVEGPTGRTRVRIRLLAALFLCATVACSGGDDEVPATDTGVTMEDGGNPEDSGLPDAGFVDAGPQDAGPLPELPQRFSEVACADCEDGCDTNQCLQTQTERFCSDRCDADPEACPEGFTCFDVSQGNEQFFCIPPAATCATGVGYGQRCVGDSSACAPVADHCEGDFHNFGYCTMTCNAPQQCPSGYDCLFGDEGEFVCRPTFLAPAETCARENDGEIPCAVDHQCGALPDARCVRTEPSLPGVCALPCDAGCPEGTTCASTARGERCLSDRCMCHASRLPDDAPAGTRDLLDEALAQVGLTPCSALFDIYAWTLAPPDVLSDPYRLSFFNPTHNEVLRGPDWAKGVTADLDGFVTAGEAPSRTAARMVERLATLADAPPVRQTPSGLDMAEPLVTAIADLVTAAGGAPDLPGLRADAQDVPMDLQVALATVIEGMTRAYTARGNAADGQTVTQLYDYGPAFVARRADGFGLAPANPSVRYLLSEGFGYDHMYGGAVDLLDAVADADLSRFAGTPTATTATAAAFLFSQTTPLGRIAIGDAENGVYDPSLAGQDGEWALLLDLGGDDQYRVPAGGNRSAANAVSVLIDLGGADLYGYVEVPNMLDGDRLPSDAGGRYAPQAGPDQDNGPISLSEVPRQGGGRMGTAVLLDLGAGDDEYRSLRMSQGSGIFGTGVLIDDGGDDLYLSETVAQGAGAFGIGLLLDLGGSDRRESYSMAQGFAFAKAVALLYDRDGDDTYFMDSGDPALGGDPLYYSSQRPGQANSSLGQGFGFGRRADFTDRAFMSGGVGMLIDGGGADRYEASIFAQGGGFWFGTGILADHSGDDQYDSIWYGMGAGAHYALGFLLEGGGNDVYGGTLPRVNVTIAGAHDYTAAFLIDESGDDVYMGSRITLGSGNVNGMGFFVDNAGSDQYDARSDYALGNAKLGEGQEPGGARRKVISLGVFIDAGTEMDDYTIDGMPHMGVGDDSVWRQSQTDDPLISAVELGSGVDGDGESTLHFP